MELSYISSVLMYISETLSATSLLFSVTIWVSVRVCEHSINDDGLAAVCTVYTISVIKSQQCRILHRAEKKYWTFVASIVLKDGSFVLLSAQTQQQIYQERCFSGALFQISEHADQNLLKLTQKRSHANLSEGFTGIQAC